MAILTHDVNGNTTNFNTNLTVGDSWTVGTQTATADNGTVVYSIVGDTAVDTATAGTYPVQYSAEDDDNTPDVITESVIVAAAPAIPTDTEKFIDGSQDRFGNDTSGTGYETVVQTPPATEVQSGIFDENAIDPYELGHANKNK